MQGASMARSVSAKKPPKKLAPEAPAPDSVPPDSEAGFLAGYDVSAFERPPVPVDVVVLTASKEGLQVVLYPRHEHPHRGRYALPGGFVRLDESLDDAAARLLRDKAGLR